MQGFMAGLRKETPALDAQLGDVTSLVGRAGGGTSAAPAGGGGTHYHFAPGSITLDASKIRDLRDLLDMIDGVRSTARQYGAVPVGV
jgi:hypothetical protein